MTRIRIKGLKGQTKLIKARAQRLARVALLDKKLVEKIKSDLLLPVKKSGILPSGEKVKGFSAAWGKRRALLSAVNKTSKFYRRFFSNLTFSGRFLSSFVAEIQIKGKQINYAIFPTGNHPGYKGLKGKRGKSVPNATIGQGQIDQGRDYTQVSNKNLELIRKRLIGRIRREFKLNLKI